MRSLCLALALALVGFTASSAAASGPNWGRRPIYINGEWVGYTYNYPTYTNSPTRVQGGTVNLPPAYYNAPPISVTPGFDNGTVYNNGRVYNTNGYFHWHNYYYGR